MTARILIVDDSRVNIHLMTAKLEAEYYQVLEAENGFDALASAYIWQPDLILLDVMMPEMDGYECCQYLKAETVTANIPVVMVTALNEPQERNRGLAAGADDFLTKPVDYDILVARIGSLVRIRRLVLDLSLSFSGPEADAIALGSTSEKLAFNGNAVIRSDLSDMKALRSHFISDNVTPIFTSTDQELLCMLSVIQFVICLMELSPEASDSLRVLSVLRASDTAHDVPVLVVSERSRKSELVTALSLGATDCLFAPIDPIEVSLRTRNQLRRSFYRLTLRHNIDNMFRLSMLDSLTGAYNRTFLNGYMQHVAKVGIQLTVLMVDVDFFKNINDQYGHTCGDQALRCITGSFKRHLRSADLVVRYGGEEFLVIMPNVGMAEARQIAERLRASVEKLAVPTSIPDRDLRLTVSVGVADSEHAGGNLQDIIASADRALYAAKQNGRNRVELSC